MISQDCRSGDHVGACVQCDCYCHQAPPPSRARFPLGDALTAAADAQTRSQFATLVNLLQAWMAENSRSPLDGTTTCRHCKALVLEQHSAAHTDWHRRNDH